MPIVTETYNAGAQFRVTVLGEWNDAEAIQNVYEIMMTSGTNVPGQDVLDDLVDYFYTLYLILDGILSVLTVFRGIRVQELDGANTTGELAFTVPVAGFVTGDPLPPGVAALVNFQTGVAHRPLKKYFGGFGESSLIPEGVWASGVITTLGLAATHLLTQQAEIHETWRYSHNAGVTLGVIFPTSAEVPVVPSYQRRRKQGVGI